MLTFERNNRESIHRLSPKSAFWDLCELYEALYLCNDALNVAQIHEGDLIKFNLYTDGKIEKVYGICTEIVNYNQMTFMVLSHIDQNGKEFFLDYVYSSFLHAFVRLNHSGRFEEWSKATFAKDAKTPDWFKEYWITNKAPNKISTLGPVLTTDKVQDNRWQEPARTPEFDEPAKADQEQFDKLVEEYVELECLMERLKDHLINFTSRI